MTSTEDKNALHGIIINGKKMGMNTANELVATLFDVPLFHARNGSLEAFKDNIRETSLLISEYCVMQQSTLKQAKTPEDTETKKRLTAEKAYYTRLKSKVIGISTLCSKGRSKADVYMIVYNFKLALEGQALLTGFQYTKKLFKERPRGNAERTSIFKAL